MAATPAVFVAEPTQHSDRSQNGCHIVPGEGKNGPYQSNGNTQGCEKRPDGRLRQNHSELRLSFQDAGHQRFAAIRSHAYYFHAIP
jgi:hypothetical protein